jgi:hypothetical protein
LLIFLVIQLDYPKNVTLEVGDRQRSIISFQQFLAIFPSIAGSRWEERLTSTLTLSAIEEANYE